LGWFKRYPVRSVVIALVALMGIAIAWRLLAVPMGPPRMAAPPVPVTAMRIAQAEFRDEILALGTAEARQSVTINAKVTETVRAVNFRDGQPVKSGDILVELTNAEQSAQLAEARAELQEANQTLERVQGLIQRGAATQSRLDQAQAARNTAQARVEGIAARMSDRLIRAAFDGVVGFRSVSPGSTVSPGTVITTLDDVSTVKVDFSVPERFLSALAEGQTIQARSDAYDDRVFEGAVTAINPRIDPVTRTVTVRAEIPNADAALRPGMLMTVRLQKDKRIALAAPERSVYGRADAHYVYKLTQDGKAMETPVEIGVRTPGKIEILSGLTAGDRIVVDGVTRLRSGATVNILSEEAPLGS
jgi:membrane fusion protein (multidrug efflux system)